VSETKKDDAPAPRCGKPLANGRTCLREAGHESSGKGCVGSKNDLFHEAFKGAFAAGLNEDAEENGDD
jgi:hypothetical protein